MDYHAKAVLWNITPTVQPRQEAFPLEPVSVFIGNTKVTTDNMDCLRFWAHKHLAKEKLHSMRILHTQAFDLVDWEIVYHTLWGVPKLFQLWACKQVTGVAGTKEWDTLTIHKCPCCLQDAIHANMSYTAVTTGGLKHFTIP
jgi:hypothetical protein